MKAITNYLANLAKANTQFIIIVACLIALMFGYTVYRQHAALVAVVGINQQLVAENQKLVQERQLLVKHTQTLHSQVASYEADQNRPFYKKVLGLR